MRDVHQSISCLSESISTVLQGKTDLCNALWASIVDDKTIPKSMRMLVDKLKGAGVAPVIAVPDMVSQMHRIGDTWCTYWWDLPMLQTFCSEKMESVVVLGTIYNKKARRYDLRLLCFMDGGSDTFIVMLHHVEHFMPCFLEPDEGEQEARFNRYERDRFFEKYPEIAIEIDPDNRRWFKKKNQAHGSSSSLVVPAVGVAIVPAVVPAVAEQPHGMTIKEKMAGKQIEHGNTPPYEVQENVVGEEVSLFISTQYH